MDNLIRLADQHPEVLLRIEAQRRPHRRDEIAGYIRGLGASKSAAAASLAAHEGELDPDTAARLTPAGDGRRAYRRRLMKPQPSTVLAPTSAELVECLLAETDQRSARPVEVQPLMDMLQLVSLRADFETELPEARTMAGEPVRALLNYQERLVAVHSALNDRRGRFSSLHEVGHYVLPGHTGQIVACGASDLSIRAARSQEREANAFAADLQFKGRLFKLETAALTISAATVRHIANTFDASFESSARRLVESSQRPCLFAVYQRKGADDSSMPSTSVRYSIASTNFEQTYGTQLSDDDNEHVLAVWSTGRDIADSITDDVMVETADGETTRFHAEYFFNGYNAFCLLST